MSAQSPEKALMSIENLFSVLSNKDRIKILGMLFKKETDVTEIHRTLGISQSRASQHLKLMKLGALVSERRLGKRVFYKMAAPQLATVIVAALHVQLANFASDPEITVLIQETLKYWQV